MNERPDFEGVLAEHEGCRANDSRDGHYISSCDTGVDVWTCGIEIPFIDDYEDMSRAHLAAALNAEVDRWDRARQAGARWALMEPSVWESPDDRSVPTLLAAIGQTLAALSTPAEPNETADGGGDGEHR